jgi:hypothetical protein
LKLMNPNFPLFFIFLFYFGEKIYFSVVNS